MSVISSITGCGSALWRRAPTEVDTWFAAEDTGWPLALVPMCDELELVGAPPAPGAAAVAGRVARDRGPVLARELLRRLNGSRGIAAAA